MRFLVFNQNSSDMNSNVMSLAVFFMPILMLAVKGGYVISNLIFLLLAVGVISRSRSGVPKDKSHEVHDIRLLVGFWGFVAIGIGLCLHHQLTPRYFSSYIPFLLAPIIYFGVARSAVSISILWFGSATAGLVAFGLSFYQLHVQGIDRSYGFMTNPIFFGNSALIAAAVSLVGLSALPAASRHPLAVTYLLLGAVAGIGTSFFSGSKGGWISLPLLILLVYHLSATSWSRKTVRIGAAIVLTALLAIIVSPKSPVLQRLQNFSQDLALWMRHESSSLENTGTASSRLEMWRFSVAVAAEHPILGFGPHALKERKAVAVINGDSDPIVTSFAHVHNEIMDIYLENGLVGLTGFILLFGSLLMVFYEHRHSQDPQLRALAIAGILFLLLFLEFGLTNPLFPFNAPRNIFCGWAAVLAGLLHAHLISKNGRRTHDPHAGGR